MGFAFPIGVPLGAYALLWSRRQEIDERETRWVGVGGVPNQSAGMNFDQKEFTNTLNLISPLSRSLGDEELMVLSFFFRNYGPKRWRMAVWDMVRRLMPCFLLATCERPAQVLLGARIVSCGFMVRDRGSYVRHAHSIALFFSYSPTRPSFRPALPKCPSDFMARAGPVLGSVI